MAAARPCCAYTACPQFDYSWTGLAAWLEQALTAGLELDGYQCQRCEATEDLTVHLDPALGANHAAATVDDCLTLRRSCHGTEDAPRAKGYRLRNIGATG